MGPYTELKTYPFDVGELNTLLDYFQLQTNAACLKGDESNSVVYTHIDACLANKEAVRAFKELKGKVYQSAFEQSKGAQSVSYEESHKQELLWHLRCICVWLCNPECVDPPIISSLPHALLTVFKQQAPSRSKAKQGNEKAPKRPGVQEFNSRQVGSPFCILEGKLRDAGRVVRVAALAVSNGGGAVK